MIKNLEKLAEFLSARARELARGCDKVFVGVSGGIDSATVAAVLCRTFGPENTVGLYRDIRSNPKHREDAKSLQTALGFKLMVLDCNFIYDHLLRQIKDEFERVGLRWVDEKDEQAGVTGFTNAYGSLKSRFMVPIGGFVSKAIDGGRGRVFGTGNGEEDGLLRYFDKFGDGAVDSNILAGLNKAEVRQLARHLGVPENIVTKLPTADLEANGDKHNDEDQLSVWAKNLGFNIRISYGASDGSSEGNVAWAWREDLNQGVITGANAQKNKDELMTPPFSYTDEQAQTVLFLREIEKITRHKVEPIPGTNRRELMDAGLVD